MVYLLSWYSYQSCWGNDWNLPTWNNDDDDDDDDADAGLLYYNDF